MTDTPPTEPETQTDAPAIDAPAPDGPGPDGDPAPIIVPDSDTAPGAEPPIRLDAEADPAQPEARPRTKPFRKKFTTVRLDPASAARQSRIALFAWDKLGGKDGASAFLNSHDDALGGRPLDLAVASDAGLAAVEQAITARAASGTGG
ncbi:antitoxin Xre/MbcA/ParS toxin-binding domain-containing protein [Sphingomonas sp. HF-S3]|uniref:Antitoxin Xre/MbcA/ParS toxin-binding domain-containing protein n=1 Tax=Sphingomonas rustica TaxID=3103142 RepID=A0ABV0BFM6_9SPHN